MEEMGAPRCADSFALVLNPACGAGPRSLAGAGAARVAAADLMPLLLGLTAVLLGRAHYAVHVRHQRKPLESA